ncbi:alpha-L-glutamate ligase-like protein [Spongiibacter taiwanensis]|uniref:alpha-L-glutamate ligase-like protein n=1 Tax=Spongiibacter taiwanensis TaxID=1748242 RepID=UPI002035B974|nr:alpha-L-glutamate ligase-like protein [Spongiibacter taiwanensis]USA41736.1 alpha-L-glutamate ligase-like protein [Spongiibacter taiwanensis]
MSLFSTWRSLREQGIMGINQRNADYVLRYNSRHLYPLVDDKIKTKRRASDAGIHVPPMYGIIDSEKGIAKLGDIVKGHRDFVIKPAQGAGGDGIMVIADQFEGYYRTTSGKMLSAEDIEFQLSGILSGIYSLGGHRDRALVEYRVKPDPIFTAISYEGVPDIRIIVLRGYPIMAMLRLPTRQSGGKANLHQGAIGVGVDLATGITLDGTWQNKKIQIHPDTTNPVRGVQLPFWDGFMSLATRCYELTGLGYLGVDMVLDKDLGPLMLELNARPGLSIQIANDCGLALRCEKVEKEIARLAAKGIARPSPEKRMAFCQKNFFDPRYAAVASSSAASNAEPPAASQATEQPAPPPTSDESAPAPDQNPPQ